MICTALLALAAGVAAAMFWPPAVAALWGCALACAALGLAAVLSRGRVRCAALIMAVLALGLAWGQGQGLRLAASLLPPALEGADLELGGRIVDLPRRDPRRLVFLLRVSELRHGGRILDGGPGLVRLSWYGAPEQLALGHEIAAVVRLRPPRTLRNPGGFDYAAWLLGNGIHASGYVRQGRLVADLASPVGRWRRALQQRISARGEEGRALMAALLLGDRSDMGNEQRQLFRSAGISHLLAISGLHIGLAAGFGWLFGMLFGRTLVVAGVLRRAQPPALVGAMGMALLYGALSGYGIPAVRALIMLGCFVVPQLLGLRLRSSIGFFAALALVLMAQPLAPLQTGFWLSFGAVAVLMMAARPRQRPGWMAGLVRVQWLLLIGFSTLALLATGIFAPLGLPINLVAVPVVGLVVVPALLLGALPGASGPLWGLAQLLLGQLEAALIQMAPLLPTVAAPALPPWLWGLAFAAGWLLLLPGWMAGRVLPSLALLGVLAVLLWPPADERLRVQVLDVGQGLAVVIARGRDAMVVDAGPRFGARFDSGSGIVAPALRQLGIRRLHSLLISHADNDHSGGSAGLLASLPAAGLLAPPELAHLHPHSRACRAGLSWSWGGAHPVHFAIIHPQGHEGDNRNRRSCVLLVRHRGLTMLFPGDIYAAEERSLRGHPLLAGRRLDLLVAAHHGSNTSSSAAFVQALRPRAVVFSTGHDNRFGHPHARVRERFAALGAQTWNTAHHGALEFVATDDGLQPRQPWHLWPWWWRAHAGQ